MDEEFDLNEWDGIAIKLKEAYPQLTSADLVWRYGTKKDFYMIIASKLGMSVKKFKSMISLL